MAYDAFLSYNRENDEWLAKTVQAGLRQFAPPSRGSRRLRIFRDESHLPASPELWAAIREALAASRHLILIASPAARDSRWVRRELEHWFGELGRSGIVIVLASGKIVWKESAADFDWERTTSLPEILAQWMREEPRYVDLSQATQERLPPRHPLLHGKLAEIAATLYNVDKETVLGEERRQRRRNRWLLATAAVFLISLVALLVSTGRIARSRSQEAALQLRERQRAMAETRISQAVAAVAERRWSRAALLFREATLLDSGRSDAAWMADLAGLIAPQPVRALARDEFPVFGLDWSPDGKRLFVGTFGGSSTLYDVASSAPTTERLYGVFMTHSALSSDGDHIAYATRDGRVVILDTKGGLAVRESWLGRSPVTGLEFSRNGSLLAVALEDGTMAIVPLAHPRQQVVLHAPREIHAFALSPDGAKTATILRDETLVVTDVRTRREISLPTGLSFGTSVQFSPDGRYIAFTESIGTVALATVGPGDLAFFYRFTTSRDRITSLAFSRDGSLLAAGTTEGTVFVWDLETKQLLARIQEDKKQVSRLAFSPSGEELAIGSGQDLVIAPFSEHFVSVWRLGFASYLHKIEMEERVETLAFAPRGPAIAALSSEGRLMLRDRRSLSEIPGPPRESEPLAAFAFAPTGQALALAAHSGGVRIWNFGLGRETLFIPDLAADSLVFSPDGRWLAASETDRHIRVVDAQTGHEVFRAYSYNMNPLEIAFQPSPRSSLLAAAGSGSNLLFLWEVPSGKELFRLEKMKSHGPTHLSFSKEGGLLAAAFRGALARVDVRSLTVKMAQPWGNEDGPDAIAFGPQSQFVLGVDDVRGLCAWSIEGRPGSPCMDLLAGDRLAVSPAGDLAIAQRRSHHAVITLVAGERLRRR